MLTSDCYSLRMTAAPRATNSTTATRAASTCNAADVASPFGTLDSQDILVYFTQFQNGTATDFDGEPGLTFSDTLVFLSLIEQCCP